jgi:hypothetical protein
MKLTWSRFVLVTAAIALWVPHIAQSQAASEPSKVIYDQDTDGIIGDNTDPLVMLMQSPNIQVLGVTVVTGNGWLRQETADVLKLLEDLHRTNIPVYMGAEFPLVQSRYTPSRMVHQYGVLALIRFSVRMANSVLAPILSNHRREVCPLPSRRPAPLLSSSSSRCAAIPTR